jgi:hypothetical protein
VSRCALTAAVIGTVLIIADRQLCQ